MPMTVNMPVSIVGYGARFKMAELAMRLSAEIVVI